MSAAADGPIAITGATGMFGGYVSRALLDACQPIRAVVRRPEAAGELASRGAEVRTADLLAPGSLEEAVRGCRAVVANAALVWNPRRPAAASFHQNNVQGARNLLEAVVTEGVPRLVWISGLAVYRPQLFHRLDESSPLVGTRRPRTSWGAYAVSKVEAERLAIETAQKHGLALVVLRPGMMYGAGDRNFTTSVWWMLNRRVMVAPTGRMALTYAGDVAQCVVNALEHAQTENRVFNVSDEVSMFQLLKALQKAMQARCSLWPLPLPLSLKVNSDRARTELGFQPTPVEAAARQVVLREQSTGSLQVKLPVP